ncbi:MAG: hypothetical protein C0175_02875 [Caldisericum exile]|uniref:DUF2089 domain-containing protein n=1 Tax=Caldisericum exile TaxID=693075 RepID=A0A2J6X793_9BACT|nr:MAG: hypothetical protein C0175_02875 [Caldisericum exile]
MNELGKILDLFKEGRIGKEEAVKLINALSEPKESDNQHKSRQVKIEVMENGERIVSVNVPLSLLKFFSKTAKLLHKDYIEVEGEKIPIDIDELEKVLNDPDFKGTLVNVDTDDKESGKHVKVTIELI